MESNILTQIHAKCKEPVISAEGLFNWPLEVICQLTPESRDPENWGPDNLCANSCADCGHYWTSAYEDNCCGVCGSTNIE